MTKFFKKSKKPCGHCGQCGHFGLFFAQIWIKTNFPGKKPVLVIKYSNYLPLCQKSEKPNMPFLRKKLN